uniref:Uncharacterized protein LOC116958471 n=1 Tax=Petromyzon marinus TaxID=7757 RepID=A0AAJ7XJT9_PETMA|nr:uncharacterized protein LOC116958471 [Petromyzon marinus]
MVTLLASGVQCWPLWLWGGGWGEGLLTFYVTGPQQWCLAQTSLFNSTQLPQLQLLHTTSVQLHVTSVQLYVTSEHLHATLLQLLTTSVQLHVLCAPPKQPRDIVQGDSKREGSANCSSIIGHSRQLTGPGNTVNTLTFTFALLLLLQALCLYQGGVGGSLTFCLPESSPWSTLNHLCTAPNQGSSQQGRDSRQLQEGEPHQSCVMTSVLVSTRGTPFGVGRTRNSGGVKGVRTSGVSSVEPRQFPWSLVTQRLLCHPFKFVFVATAFASLLGGGLGGAGVLTVYLPESSPWSTLAQTSNISIQLQTEEAPKGQRSQAVTGQGARSASLMSRFNSTRLRVVASGVEGVQMSGASSGESRPLTGHLVKLKRRCLSNYQRRLRALLLYRSCGGGGGGS